MLLVSCANAAARTCPTSRLSRTTSALRALCMSSRGDSLRTITGRCLCGGVRFEINGGLGPVVYCHCSMCRRASGSSFATNASVRKENFRILSGHELLTEYESSPGNRRTFCSKCGSPLFGTAADIPSARRVRLGALDNVDGAKAVAHIWTGSKSDWFKITDGLEQFEEEPPDSYCAPG